jgi:uncharacterized membrane protein (UPF0127 family)
MWQDEWIAEARTPLARLRGLAWRDDAPGALHLPRCRSVHTFGMRFPLDLFWLDAAGEIVRVDHGVPPRRFKSCRRARSVLEVRSPERDRGDPGHDEHGTREALRRHLLAAGDGRAGGGHDDAGLA